MADRANAMEELRLLLAGREPLYALCDASVDTSVYDEDGALAVLTRVSGQLGWDES